MSLSASYDQTLSRLTLLKTAAESHRKRKGVYWPGVGLGLAGLGGGAYLYDRISNQGQGLNSLASSIVGLFKSKPKDYSDINRQIGKDIVGTVDAHAKVLENQQQDFQNQALSSSSLSPAVGSVASVASHVPLPAWFAPDVAAVVAKRYGSPATAKWLGNTSSVVGRATMPLFSGMQGFSLSTNPLVEEAYQDLLPNLPSGTRTMAATGLTAASGLSRRAGLPGAVLTYLTNKNLDERTKQLNDFTAQTLAAARMAEELKQLLYGGNPAADSAATDFKLPFGLLNLPKEAPDSYKQEWQKSFAPVVQQYISNIDRSGIFQPKSYKYDAWYNPLKLPNLPWYHPLRYGGIAGHIIAPPGKTTTEMGTYQRLLDQARKAAVLPRQN